MGYNSKVYRKQGGKELVVDNGGKITTNSGGYVLKSVAAVTAVGTDQATAVPLVAEVNVVAGADGTVGAVLPTAQAGMQITVKTTVAGQVLKVYPATGAAINAIAANSAISMAALTSAIFTATSATQWYTTPLLPS